MMNTFVCKLFDSDSFHVKGATVVNLNDNNQYNYTFGIFLKIVLHTIHLYERGFGFVLHFAHGILCR